MGNIEELKEQIREEGVKVPMYGYSQREDDGETYYYIVDGSRRYAACKLLSEEGGPELSIKFMPQPKRTNKEQNTLERLLRNEGKPYTPYEISIEINKLVNYGWPEKKIATKLGKSETYVKQLLSLAHAPQKVQNLLAEDKVSATLAIQTLAKGDDAVEELVQKAEETPKEAQNGTELFQEPQSPKGKTTRVTAKDLAPSLNSWKEFKKWAEQADNSKMSDTANAFFKFLCKMTVNELKQEDIADFFTHPTYK
jgi:ParB/RepB/Spo0J family partition protein